MEPRKVRLNGISVNYTKIGTGAPLVFIHGWANNWESWIPLVQHLKQDFTLYLLDLPGYGHSDNLTKYDIATNAWVVSKFIQQLHLVKPSLVGLSMGSFIAAECALQYANNIHSTILLGPLVKKKKRVSRYLLVTAYLKFFGLSRIGKFTLKKIVESKRVGYAVSKYMNMYRFKKEMIDKYGESGRKLMRIEAFIDMGLSVTRYDYDATLRKLKVPTLMVYGRQDKIASFKNALPLLSVNNNLQLATISNCGHIPHWEQTEKLARNIKNFLK